MHSFLYFFFFILSCYATVSVKQYIISCMIGPDRPVATYLKVVQRKSERVPKARVGRVREGVIPSCKGGSGDLPREIFKFMVASMCVFNAFLMRFGLNFSRLRLIWNRRHLHESIMEH